MSNVQDPKTHHPSFFALNPTPSTLHSQPYNSIIYSASFNFQPYNTGESLMVQSQRCQIHITVKPFIHFISPWTVPPLLPSSIFQLLTKIKKLLKPGKLICVPNNYFFCSALFAQKKLKEHVVLSFPSLECSFLSWPWGLLSSFWFNSIMVFKLSLGYCSPSLFTIISLSFASPGPCSFWHFCC